MSRCRSCGKEIRWITMTRGTRMPVDVGEILYKTNTKGKSIIVTPNGEVHKADIVPDGTPDATGIGYISHFATCPNADQHRKRGGK